MWWCTLNLQKKKKKKKKKKNLNTGKVSPKNWEPRKHNIVNFIYSERF